MFYKNISIQMAEFNKNSWIMGSDIAQILTKSQKL